jgi:aspartyl-tRNA(Asn)/glutamyl-tRNA(Gln) amidotransferase subunit B
MSLINLENGARVQYFYKVLAHFERMIEEAIADDAIPDVKSYAGLIGNWTIHELGRLTTSRAGPLGQVDLDFTPEGECIQVPDSELAQILFHLYRKHITGKVAKELLMALYLGELEGGVLQSIEAHDLWFKELSPEEYEALVDEVVDGEDKVLQELVSSETFPQGKLMFLVGKMMRAGQTERIDPATAERVLRDRVQKLRAP